MHASSRGITPRPCTEQKHRQAHTEYGVQYIVNHVYSLYERTEKRQHIHTPYVLDTHGMIVTYFVMHSDESHRFIGSCCELDRLA